LLERKRDRDLLAGVVEEIQANGLAILDLLEITSGSRPVAGSLFSVSSAAT
jgi:hypothetical protein